MRAVADAGPLIHLSWVNQLGLLNGLFEEVLLSPAVRDEVLATRAGTLGLDRLRIMFDDGRFRVLAPVRPFDLVQATEAALDHGEAEALQLAAETSSSILLTDDAPARAEASRRGIAATGTVGILVRARAQGLIQKALPIVLELRRLGQWMSDSLVQFVQEMEERPLG